MYNVHIYETMNTKMSTERASRTHKYIFNCIEFQYIDLLEMIRVRKHRTLWHILHTSYDSKWLGFLAL